MEQEKQLENTENEYVSNDIETQGETHRHHSHSSHHHSSSSHSRKKHSSRHKKRRKSKKSLFDRIERKFGHKRLLVFSLVVTVVILGGVILLETLNEYDVEIPDTTDSQAEQDVATNSNKLYSFCAISDVHIGYVTADEDLQRALIYAEDNCDFTCIAGDLTSNAIIESQLETYKHIVDTYALSKPVYAISGNHENYNGYSDQYLEKYTGYPLCYSFTKGDDVFIMLGHYGAYRGDGIGWLSTEFISVDELQWLYQTLEENRDKRCFIFTHVFPNDHGVGNPQNLAGISGIPLLWNTKDGGIGQTFINLLKHYKNTILFHGHSHTRFDLQNVAANANYSDANGYRSIHIPSLTVPRDVANGVLIDLYEESEGYIIDVYDDYILLKGRDFVDGNWVFGATYKIDTKLCTVEPNTFVDNTGLLS